MTDQMPEIDPQQQQDAQSAGLPAEARPGLKWASVRWARVFCAVVMLGAISWLMVLLVRGRALDVHWSWQVLLGVCAVTACAWMFVAQHWYWTRAGGRLVATIAQIRAGGLPIDDLARIEGGMAPVAAAVAEVFRDLRRQRGEYVSLHNEMQQRIAHRTGALERLVGSLRAQATRDALTGLYNRRQLAEVLPRLIEDCLEQRQPLAVLMIDIDHFKQVNDTLGHPAGDKLLRNVGQLIRSSIRERDMAFRCGGDEFVVVLPQQDREAAGVLGDRLQSLMDGLGRTLRTPLKPRLSIGLAMLSDLASPDADGLLAEADKRLYEVKHARGGSRAPNAA